MGTKNSSRGLGRDFGWHEVAAVRARDLRMRLVFSLFIASAGCFAAKGAAWPLLWLASTLSAQLASLVITEPMRRDPDFLVSRRRSFAFFASLALSAAVFASAGWLFWFNGGWGGRLFAVIIMAGGAVNVALQAGSSAGMLWTGCVPFMVMLQSLPLMSFFLEPEAERGVMGMTSFAATLFVAHLIAAGRQHLANARKLQAALDEANRERERAELASSAKTEFLGLMSHELRTPLNGVLGMVQAMQADQLTPEQRDRLEVIRDSGEILRSLLSEVLDVPQAVDLARRPADRFLPQLRVLAAEDNPTNQLVLTTLLSQAGVHVHLVCDGEEAVAAWREAPWDLLLMDIRMPRLDGLAATRAIRAAEAAEGRPRTPIIAVTAEATAEQALDYMAAGMDGLVPKPIQFAQLAAVILSVMDAGSRDRGAAAA